MVKLREKTKYMLQEAIGEGCEIDEFVQEISEQDSDMSMNFKAQAKFLE